MRLFCFPYAGGHEIAFSRWRADMSPDVEVWPVELPGRGRRASEPLCMDLDTMLAAVVDSIVPHLESPFALFGHSMGALIAFELARRLRVSDRVSPVALYVSGRRAPHIVREVAALYALPSADLFAALRDLGTVVTENLRIRTRIEPVLRADFQVAQTYRFTPGQPLSCPIVAFGGTSDPCCTRTDLEAWREHTTGPFRLEWVDGGHFFIQSRRRAFLALLSDDLRGRMQRLSAAVAPAAAAIEREC